MRFKRKNGEIYYSIAIIEGRFKVVFFEWVLNESDIGRFKERNCFRTKEDADIALCKIKKALKRRNK